MLGNLAPRGPEGAPVWYLELKRKAPVAAEWLKFHCLGKEFMYAATEGAVTLENQSSNQGEGEAISELYKEFTFLLFITLYFTISHWVPRVWVTPFLNAEQKADPLTGKKWREMTISWIFSGQISVPRIE